MSKVRLQEDGGFCFRHPLMLSHLLAAREASCRGMSCPMKRPMWQETDVSSGQPAGAGGLLTAMAVSSEPDLSPGEPHK